MSDWWNQPGNLAKPEPVTRSDRVCPWCSAVAPMDSTSCPSCGAVMAQRESLGGLVIPGVTNVDQDMAEPTLTGSLLRSQTQMSTLNALGASGGSGVQLAVAAGYLAKDSLRGILSEPVDQNAVGQPSQAALEMARQLDGQPAETSHEMGGQLAQPAAEPSTGTEWQAAAEPDESAADPH